MLFRSKSLMDSEELLVMGVIVELWSGQSLGIVGDRPDLLIRTTNGENANDGIVRGICLYDDRSRGEGVFEVLKGGVTGVTEVPRNTFMDEAGQRSDNCYAWSWVRGKCSLWVKGSEYEEGLLLVGSRGSYARDFLGVGQGFEDESPVQSTGEGSQRVRDKRRKRGTRLV